MNWGPDERIYAAQGQAVRSMGLLRGLRALADDFIREPQARQYPSALRWLWIVFCSRLGSEQRIAFASAVAAAAIAGQCAMYYGLSAGALVLASPLLLLVGRRALQDSVVALIGLDLLATPITGYPIVAGVFVLLSVKEAAVLWLPALIAAKPDSWPFAFAGVALWLVTLVVIFGPRRLRELLPLVAKSHDHEYTRQCQSGGPQRYLVDLVLISPLPLGTALMVTLGREFWYAVALIAAHCLVGVKNARFILGADILLRVAAAQALGWYALLLIPWDIWTSWRLRGVYDPVTVALTRAMRMS